MGHAHLTNISTFFINRLYAKGKLSIRECAEALQKAGETLHASEGEYEDLGMLSMGLLDIVHYLTRHYPMSDGYSGPASGGPWIEPALTFWHGKRKSVTRLTRVMLDELERGGNDPLTINGVADRLEEEGFPDWSAAVFQTSRQREVYNQWRLDNDGDWDWDEENPNSEGMVFDMLPWRFTKGWRNKYRDVPILSNVTH